MHARNGTEGSLRWTGLSATTRETEEVPCNILKNIECVSLIARLSRRTRIGPPAFEPANTRNRQNNLPTSLIAHLWRRTCHGTRRTSSRRGGASANAEAAGLSGQPSPDVLRNARIYDFRPFHLMSAQVHRRRDWSVPLDGRAAGIRRFSIMNSWQP